MSALQKPPENDETRRISISGDLMSHGRRRPSAGPEVRSRIARVRKPLIPMNETPVQKEQEEVRERTSETLNFPILTREATFSDISAIHEIYEYYPREAFQYIAELTHEDLKRIKALPPEHPEKGTFTTMTKSLSGGGEFLPITDEEWRERIEDPGKRVMVILHGITGKIIGVNSYCLGSKDPFVSKRISRIGFNKEEGENWYQTLFKRNPEKPFDKVIYIEDTFFDLEFRGKALFRNAYLDMIRKEIENGTIVRGEISQWSLVYCLNFFKGICELGKKEYVEGFVDVAGTLKNFATTVASTKLHGVEIGYTENAPICVPQIVPPYDDLLTKNGKPIIVQRDFVDFLIRINEELAQDL